MSSEASAAGAAAVAMFGADIEEGSEGALSPPPAAAPTSGVTPDEADGDPKTTLVSQPPSKPMAATAEAQPEVTTKTRVYREGDSLVVEVTTRITGLPR